MSRKSRSTTNDNHTDISPADTSTALAEPPTGTDSEPSSAAQAPSPANDNQPTFAQRVGQRKSPIAPDPFGIAGDYQAGVRLFESRQDHQMALKFDEKPSQAVIDKLKEAGFRWNPTDRIWAHPVWPASAMSTRIKAERLYQEVRQMIRDEKGIDSSPEIPF
jgi:hypothetical protein